MYSAYADASLGVLARLAGADGVVHKGARAPELFETLRRIHAGEQLLPPLSPSAIAEVAGEVDADDRPLIGLLLHGTPTREIAEVFHQDPKTVRRRIDGLLRDLAREPMLPTA
jgi:DNA-binding NarL/FixJ family response regulator